MIRNSVARIVVGGILLADVLLLPQGVCSDGWVSVLPIEYRVGAIPVPYQPFNYTAFPYTLGSIPDVTDGSLNTYTHLQGLDEVLQSNGAVVDTGTFYLFQYQVDPDAVAFRIRFTGRVEDNETQGAFNEFMIAVLSPDGVNPSHSLRWVEASETTTFGINIWRDGNSGDAPLAERYGLDYTMNPDGRMWVLLQGGYAASLSGPGVLNSYLYDVSAEFTTVPEPSSMAVGGLGLLMLGAMAFWKTGRRRAWD